MQTSKNDQFAWIFETESKDDLSDLFAAGEGILQFMPEMSDEAIVIAIRHALSISAGKPFLVMPGKKT